MTPTQGCTLLSPQPPARGHSPHGVTHQHQARCCQPLIIPKEVPAPCQPRGTRDVWGGQPGSSTGRRAEVRTEETAINKCKYSKEAPGQSCEGHQSVCQQISNPPAQWHLTKCHCG